MTMAETARMEFAYQIQRFTHVNHMTAEMFAMECGVQKKTVDSALEEKPVSSRAMQKICSYVGITLDSLWQPPISENFLKLEEIMLDTVQPGVLPSIQLAAKNVVDALEGMPPYEQKRNLRWLRQIVERLVNLQASLSGTELLLQILRGGSLPPVPLLPPPLLFSEVGEPAVFPNLA